MPYSVSSRKAVIFEHISHSGGATVTDILRRNFPLVLWGEVENPWHFLPLVPPDAGEVVISNGYCRNLHADLPRDFDAFYLTMLRDPWRRALSAFNYSQMKGLIECGLEEFLATRMTPNELVNTFGAGSLQEAKRRLEHDYFGFGICERFDESLELLGRCIPLPDKSYVVVARSNSWKVIPEPRLVSLYSRRNGPDMELYRFALQLFENRLRQAGITNVPGHELQDATLDHSGLSSGRNPMPWQCLPTQEATDVNTDTHCDRVASTKRILELVGTDLDAADREFISYAKRFGFGVGFSLVHLARCLKSSSALEVLENEVERFRDMGNTAPDSAIAWYKAACHIAMAEISRNRRDVSCEERHLLAALALSSWNHEALAAWVDFLHRARRFPEAVEACRANASRYAPNLRAVFLARLGESLAIMRDAKGAEEAFNAAIEADPLSVEALLAFGVFLRAEGRAAQARDHFREAGLIPELAWHRHQFLKESAHTLRQMGDKAGAMSVLAELRSLPSRPQPPETARMLRTLTPLSQAIKPGMSLLVIRTAPLLLLECLLDVLGPGVNEGLEILTPPLLESHGLPDSSRILPLPAGPYSHGEHARSLDPCLWTRSRDAVVLLLSDECLDNAGEVLQLARSIPARALYLYTFRQVFSPGQAGSCLVLPFG